MNRDPYVTFVNGWHDDNKGDSAIVMGLMQLIRAAVPNCRFGIVSSLNERGHSFQTAHRHLLRMIPDLEVAGNPLSLPSEYVRRSAGRRVCFEALCTAQALGAASGLWSGTAAERLLKRADVVISKGGHFIHGGRAYHPMDMLQLVRVLLPSVMAIRLGRPLVVFGQSLGPFPDAPTRLLASRVLRGAAGVLVREPISHRIAQEDLGLDPSKVRLIPDTAFAIRPVESRGVKTILAKVRAGSDVPFGVVTVRQAVLGGRTRAQRTDEFLVKMAEFSRKVLKRAVVDRIVVVAQVHGPQPLEDDRPIAAALVELIADSRVHLVLDDLSPSELGALYAQARFLVGTRFHSVILALAAEVPSIAVSYFGPKAHGIMQMMGMEDYCLDMDAFDPAEAFALLERVLRAQMRTQIQSRVAQFRRNLSDEVAHIIAEAEGVC